MSITWDIILCLPLKIVSRCVTKSHSHLLMVVHLSFLFFYRFHISRCYVMAITRPFFFPRFVKQNERRRKTNEENTEEMYIGHIEWNIFYHWLLCCVFKHTQVSQNVCKREWASKRAMRLQSNAVTRFENRATERKRERGWQSEWVRLLDNTLSHVCILVARTRVNNVCDATIFDRMFVRVRSLHWLDWTAVLLVWSQHLSVEFVCCCHQH